MSDYAMPNLLSSILLIAYGFVTVLTPNMRTFDSNGPKFMTLAILNLIVFFVLFFVAETRKDNFKLFHFFKNKIGFLYGVLILLSLLSFVKSINLNESILHFAKVFTTFSSAWFVYILVRSDKKALFPLAIAMSLLLIVDSIQTFNGVADFINEKFKNFNLIKASYSNKNILTSAIFVKLPFALWLLFSQKGWSRYFAILTLFLSILATFFMSSRAFYLGLIFISVLLVIYTLIQRRRSKGNVRNLLLYFSIIVVSFAVFSFVQYSLYPKEAQQSRSFTNRLKTVVAKDNGSNNLRLTAWGQSLNMIQKDPLLGVGLGNWKLRVLEYENQYSPTYTYMYKNHNDFLEITAESGIFAGGAFVGMFVLVLLYFIFVLVKRPDEERIKWIFLPMFGIVAYSFDAFFNFPQDRPEIQSLFALYIGLAIGLSSALGDLNMPMLKVFRLRIHPFVFTLVKLLLGILLVAIVYVLVLNVKSLKLQRIVKEEINSGKLRSPSSRFLNGFPAIPDITVLAEPIAVQKARYLINEKKHEQARTLLKNDSSNPADGRREYFMAMSYYTQKQYDSALVYAEKAHEIKPYFYNNNTIVASIYEKQGKFEQSINLWRNYVKQVQNKPSAWTVPVVLLEKLNRLKEAEQLIDSAYSFLPKNEAIANKRILIKQKLIAGSRSMSLYDEGMNLYKQREYIKAIPFFTDFIKQNPDYALAYEFRGICCYQIKKYKECLADILKEEQLGYKLKPNMINIKGACYFMLGDRKNAEQYFREAMLKGDKDGINNYNKYFKSKKSKKISFSIPEKK